MDHNAAAPLQVQNIRAAYAELGQRVYVALWIQIGDIAWLDVQQVECFQMLGYVEQVRLVTVNLDWSALLTFSKHSALMNLPRKLSLKAVYMRCFSTSKMQPLCHQIPQMRHPSQCHTSFALAGPGALVYISPETFWWPLFNIVGPLTWPIFSIALPTQFVAWPSSMGLLSLGHLSMWITSTKTSMYTGSTHLLQALYLTSRMMTWTPLLLTWFRDSRTSAAAWSMVIWNI